MRMVSKWRLMAILAVLALVAGACGGSGTATTEAANTTAAETTTTAGSTETTAAAAGDRVQVRWFVGLGAGAQPEQIAAQEEVVAAFNASQDEIELLIETVDNDVAYDQLSTQISAGNAPDIIGPVGRDGSNSYAGLYLDVEPLIESTGFDTSRWPEATVEGFRDADGKLYGLPFASYPSFIYYNKALFDEAGLPYPPSEYGPDGVTIYGEGTEWEGTWDWDKVAEISAILTVDANGVDATSPDFDRTQTVQWGFSHQWVTLLYAQGTAFGAGSPLADDGSAVVPAQWVDEWKWYHDGIWNGGWAPSQEQLDSELLAGNSFSSGNIAIANSHLWYTCCIRNDDQTGKDFFDIAPMPSHNGTVTAKVHADTFRILASTEHPEEAFQVLTYLITDAALDLLNAYGAAPADPSLTEAFYAGLDEVYPQGVNWGISDASAAFADIPSHEQFVPGWDAYKLRMADMESALLSDPTLDIDAGVAELETDLTAIFAEG